MRYFANEQARNEALPSYAVLPSVKGGAAADVSVGVAFLSSKGTNTAAVEVESGTSIYGTGEVSGPLMRNGRKIETWNSDAYGYGEEPRPLYQSHPWVLAVRKDGTAFGVLADTTYRCQIDTAATKTDQITFTAPWAGVSGDRH